MEKKKLIKQVAKKAKISDAKAQIAYETIFKEGKGWRKEGLVKVEVVSEVPVKVPGDSKIKKVEVTKEKAVKTNATKEKIKVVEVIKKVPVEVIKVVEKIKEVQVIKEVPVPVVKTVVKKVEVVREVPIEIIKEETFIREVTVPVEKIVEKKVIVKDQKAIDAWKKKCAAAEKTAANAMKAAANAKKNSADKKDLDKWKKKCAAAEKDCSAAMKKANGAMKDAANWKKKCAAAEKAAKAKPKVVTKTVEKKVVDTKGMMAWKKKYDALAKDLASAKKKLKAKPKTITKTIVKEVPVEVIKEVEVTKQIDFAQLQKMMAGMKTVQVSKKVVGETRRKAGAGKIVSRKAVSSSSKKSKSKKKSGKKDDLTKIEGIGPAIQKLIYAAGVTTFKGLSKKDANWINGVLDKGGPRFQMHNPETWSKQAGMAAKGDWDKLQKWQDEMDGGRK